MKKESLTIPRPPVVSVLGHVDHGKSTLLDYIRKTNVVAGEAGGITQHVHAYEITHGEETKRPKKITFIDTPGHAAFARSRKHGASIADIALLIISAEEGVREQTKESLSLIRSGKIPFIVVITKIDRPNANPDKVKQELAEVDVLVEEWGGKIPCVLVSAKRGDGVDELLDLISVAGELEGFSGDPRAPGEGFVLESHTDKKTGLTATAIVKNGSVHEGDFFVAGGVVSKIKRLEDFQGKKIKEATFSAPVQFAALSALPNGGAEFRAYTNKKDADLYAEHFPKKKEPRMIRQSEDSDEEDTRLMIPILIKADVSGSLDAVIGEIKKISVPEDRAYIKIIGQGIGDIAEGDLQLAKTARDPIVVGFNVKLDKVAKDYADGMGLSPKLFDIIYKLTEYVQEEITKRIPKKTREETVGKAKVIKVFNKTQGKQLIGAHVTWGTIAKDTPLRLMRGSDEIGKIRIAEMQTRNVPVKEASEGTQIGALLESKKEILLGDELVSFTSLTE